jgi:thiopeptide-type bacteriocin biosynthesis protein
VTASSDHPRSWRGLHLYYYGDQDALLVDSVRPALADLTAAGVVQRYFFLRYWMGGPHVRLRLEVAEPEGAHAERAVRDEVGRFMRSHPGEVPVDLEAVSGMQAELARLEDEEPAAVVSQDCVRNEPYRPEHAKYGGEVGVEIAESLFCESSTIVLDVLGAAAATPSRRLGTGFLATLAALRAAGMDAGETREFLAHYCRLWSRWVLADVKPLWPRRLQEHRHELRSRAAAIVAGCELPTPLRRWASAVDAAWSQVQARRHTVLPEVTLAGTTGAPDDRREQVLLSSFVHTHNNRLGLIPASEAYLGYLGHHVLSDLLAVPPLPELDEVPQPTVSAQDATGSE